MNSRTVTISSTLLEKLPDVINTLQYLCIDLDMASELPAVVKGIGQGVPDYSVEQWHRAAQKQMGKYSAPELLTYISRLLFAMQGLVDDNETLHATILTAKG